MSDGEPIQFRARRDTSQPSTSAPAAKPPAQVVFNRQELNAILNVYGRKVAEGEWRDYGMDFGKEIATFAVYRRSSEVPLYRIEKCPKLARKQGAYAVVNATGQILKRGHELSRVLQVFDKQVRLVT